MVEDSLIYSEANKASSVSINYGPAFGLVVVTFLATMASLVMYIVASEITNCCQPPKDRNVTIDNQPPVVQNPVYYATTSPQNPTYPQPTQFQTTSPHSSTYYQPTQFYSSSPPPNHPYPQTVELATALPSLPLPLPSPPPQTSDP